MFTQLKQAPSLEDGVLGAKARRTKRCYVRDTWHHRYDSLALPSVGGFVASSTLGALERNVGWN